MQPFTIRPIVLPHKANSNGIVSIRIAVTINRKVTYMATEHRIYTTQWHSKKSCVIDHPNAELINISLRRKVAEIEKDLINRNLEGTPITKNIIRGKTENDRLFSKYANQVRADQKELNRIKAFAGEGLMLSEITAQWLRNYEQHERVRLAQNSLNTAFKYLRRIIGQAYKEKLIKDNPFDAYDIPKYVQTDRMYLNKDELALLLNYAGELEGSLRVTAYYFLLGCYTGLRHSDWGRFDYASMVHDGLLRIRAKKNKKHIVLPIGVTLEKILQVVKDMPKPAGNRQCNIILKVIAIGAKVNKELTTHAARHTFGFMCASNKIPKSVTAELLGVNTQTVEVYYHLAGSDILVQAAVLKTL